MAAAHPVKKGESSLAAFAARNNLLLRVASSLVLVPLALAAAYFGGLPFILFWAIAAVGVLYEWDTLVCSHDRNSVLTIGAVALIGASILLAFDWSGTAIALVVLGIFGVATLASRVRRAWCVAGLVYAAVLMMAPVILRADASFGFAAILMVFVVVWSTDIAAYFVGRALGGPKLAPWISPSKTWSGAVGGAMAGILGGVVAAQQFGVEALTASAGVALVLSLASQVGDLLESAIKRKFGAKDSSGLIPGHGGFMDRLDGFTTAVVTALLIGLLHGGFAAPARGLMVW